MNITDIPGPHYCQRCGDLLDPKKMVWLELDQRTNTYTSGPVPENVSQGCFTFGRACAKRAEADHKKVQP